MVVLIKFIAEHFTPKTCACSDTAPKAEPVVVHLKLSLGLVPEADSGGSFFMYIRFVLTDLLTGHALYCFFPYITSLCLLCVGGSC